MKCIKLQLLIDISKVWKKHIEDGYNMKLLTMVIDTLARGEPLPAKYQNHQLKGIYSGFFDCHIQADWILIYKIEDRKLLLIDIGSHADLF